MTEDIRFLLNYSEFLCYEIKNGKIFKLKTKSLRKIVCNNCCKK